MKSDSPKLFSKPVIQAWRDLATTGSERRITMTIAVKRVKRKYPDIRLGISSDVDRAQPIEKKLTTMAPMKQRNRVMPLDPFDHSLRQDQKFRKISNMVAYNDHDMASPPSTKWL